MAENKIKKFKWLYLWIAGAALAVFSVAMILIRDFGNSIVFYLSGALLITFVVIRFVPLIKTTREKWAIAMNAIEMFIDLVVGVLMIVLTATNEDVTALYKFFPFLLGGILYVRGLIYLVEIVFFHTKADKFKFFINVLLLTAGTVVIARYNNFSVDSMRLLLALAFALCAVISIIDGFINYNNYRKTFVKVEKKVEEVVETVDNIKAPGIESDIIIEENEPTSPQNYVS